MEFYTSTDQLLAHTSNHSPWQTSQFPFMLQYYLWSKPLWQDPRWPGQWAEFLESNSHQRTAREAIRLAWAASTHPTKARLKTVHLFRSWLSKFSLNSNVSEFMKKRDKLRVEKYWECCQNLFQTVQISTLWVHGYTHCWASPEPQEVLHSLKNIFKNRQTQKLYCSKERLWGWALASQYICSCVLQLPYLFIPGLFNTFIPLEIGGTVLISSM